MNHRTARANKFLKESMLKMSQCHSVIEVGSGKPFGKELADYRDLFKNCDWKTFDICPEVSPDIVDDITKSKLASGLVDGIVCKSIFEHITEPQRAADEIYRILRPGGRLFSYVPFLHPYHTAPGYRDYYRFSADGIKYLFHLFTVVEMCAVQAPLSSILELIPEFNFMRRFIYTPLLPFDKILIWKGWMSKTTSGYYVYAEK